MATIENQNKTSNNNNKTINTLAVYTLNVYEIDGKHLAKTYVDELREHLDMLGLKYKFEMVNAVSNEQMVRDVVPTLDQISKMEETNKETSVVNSLLSSFGLGDTTSSKQTTKINDEQIIFPEHYTGVLTINLTILENPDEPEKQTKAMDAIAQILNHEIYGLDILIDKLLFKDIFQANRIVEEKDIVEDIVQDFGEELI